MCLHFTPVARGRWCGPLNRFILMKFCLYTSTPGLERFSKSERFGIWRSTHKRLMLEDADYRRRVRRSMWRLIWASIAFTIAASFFLFAIRGRAAITLNLVGLGVLSVGYTIYNTMASFRMQEFMNERVGRALQ